MPRLLGIHMLYFNLPVPARFRRVRRHGIFLVLLLLATLLPAASFVAPPSALATGGPAFSSHFFGDTAQTTSVVLGDLNGDGALDLVAGNQGSLSRIYLNDGIGSFRGAGAPLGVISPTTSLALGDLN